MLQIHQQKGEIIENVSTGQRIVELKAVEQRRLPVKEADVAKMQIAVAAAHLAGRAPAIQHRRKGRQSFAPFLEERVHLLQREAGLPLRHEATMLDFGNLAHLCAAAMVEALFGGGMERRD